MMRLCSRCCGGLLGAAFALIGTLGRADSEAIVVVSSVRDPAVAINEMFCNQAPFAAPTRMAATLYSVATETGRVQDRHARLGTATSCMSMPLRPDSGRAGREFQVAAQFVLADVTLSVAGTCRMLAADRPVKGVTLASCALTSIDDSVSVAGTATSNTVLNLANVDGYTTSSVWTLRVFR